MGQMIEAVILDIGGVVCTYSGDDLDGRWEEQLDLPKGALRERLWNTPLQKAAERGEVTFEEFWRDATTALDLTASQAQDLYDECWGMTDLDPRVRSWLETLRPRYKVATLSNSWSDGRRECSARYGLDQLVDLMVFSAEEGVAKPDPEIYVRTLSRLDVAADRALFVDDRTENVEAAQHLGMRAVLARSPEDILGEVASLLERAPAS